MVPSSKSLLLAFIAVTACLLPLTHSLSIPSRTTEKATQDDDSTGTTTSGPDSDENNGFGDLVLLESTATDPTGTDNANSNNSSTSGKRKPVLEVVDVVFRPFRPPSILVLDFFRKPNGTNNGTGSSEEDGNLGSSETSTESNKGSAVSSETDSSEGSNGIPFRKPIIGITVVQRKNGPASQMTSSSMAAQKQFGMGNEDNDDARRMSDKQNNPDDGVSNDDGDLSPMPPPSSDMASSDDASSMNTTTSEQQRRKPTAKTGEEVQTRRRVVRSATTKPETKGHPSTSPTASASPSSPTTSKPLTGKDAPAAPTPSANASAAKKASTTESDDSEGPPLLNVTEPTGKSDDD